MRRIIALALAFASATSLGAQQNSGVGAQRISDPAALMIEIGSESVGSLAAFGSTMIAYNACDDGYAEASSTHSLKAECLGVLLAGFYIVTPVATMLGNKLGRQLTRPPARSLGALLGAAVGTVIGTRMAYNLSEPGESYAGPLTAIVLSQGTFAAVGARIAGRR